MNDKPKKSLWLVRYVDYDDPGAFFAFPAYSAEDARKEFAKRFTEQIIEVSFVKELKDEQEDL